MEQKPNALHVFPSTLLWLLVVYQQHVWKAILHVRIEEIYNGAKKMGVHAIALRFCTMKESIVMFQ